MTQKLLRAPTKLERGMTHVDDVIANGKLNARIIRDLVLAGKQNPEYESKADEALTKARQKTNAYMQALKAKKHK